MYLQIKLGKLSRSLGDLVWIPRMIQLHWVIRSCKFYVVCTRLHKPYNLYLQIAILIINHCPFPILGHRLVTCISLLFTVVVVTLNSSLHFSTGCPQKNAHLCSKAPRGPKKQSYRWKLGEFWKIQEISSLMSRETLYYYLKVPEI